jgi:Flp pilus assembly protein TadG
MHAGQLLDEDGVIASQLAVLMPAILLLIMLAVQFGLWAHGTQLARAAADEAAYIAALPDSTDATGQAAAAALLDQAGNLTDIRITLERQSDLIVATVVGQAPQVVPGFAWQVQASAAAALERFIEQNERFVISEGSVAGNPRVGGAG